MALPRLPAPTQPPGRLWLLQLAVVGRATRPPEIPSAPPGSLAGPAGEGGRGQSQLQSSFI